MFGRPRFLAFGRTEGVLVSETLGGRKGGGGGRVTGAVAARLEGVATS